MLHFVLGRVKSGKTSYIFDKIKKSKTQGSLLIVPEQFSHVTERLLCERLGNSASFYTEVTNFRRLASKVKAEFGGDAESFIDGGARMLYLHSALEDVLPSLSSLSKDMLRPEKLASLLSLIDEFKAYGISPEKLASVSDEMSTSLSRKISDLALIYASYQNRLGEDSFDAYDELAFVADSVSRNNFFAGKNIYFDNFYGFTAIQFDIIEAAISKAANVYITLELPDNAEDGMESGIFNEALMTKKKLESIAKKNGIETYEAYLSREPDSALKYLDLSISSEETSVSPFPAAEICIGTADNIFEECELAAGYILEKIKNGARFRDFSVAVCDNGYLRICEAVFNRYAIPSYANYANDLISKPIVSLLLSALEISLRGFRTDLVTEYIKTGFSGISAGGLDIFENYLYTWSPKGYEWESGKDFTKNPFGLSAPETDESAKTLAVINRVRRKIYEPIQKLSVALKKSGGGEDVATALYNFINEINLPRRVSASAYLAEISSRFTEAQEFEAILGTLYEVIDNIGRIKSEKLDIEDIYHLFKLVISQYELATIPATIDCVSISDLSRADGERCKYRIVLGANDGSFPSSESDSGLLSDNDREELSELGISLAPAFCERIWGDLRRVHSVLCSAEEGLYISSLTLSSRGEEMYEADAVSRIRTLFPDFITAMSLSDARSLSRIPCFDDCVSSGRQPISDNDPELSKKLLNIYENSKNTRGPIISKENIKAVFGKKIRLSASRADLFSSCRYAYFLRYGLAAYPREKAEISPIEAGNLMHYVLEKVICRLSEDGTYEESIALEYTREAVREYLAENLGDTEKLSGRMKFLLSRIEKTVIAAVLDICTELRSGSFVPSEFELSFAQNGDLPSLELEGENSLVSFSGKVDRIDTYEKDGKLYFRVIDYKSGVKHFSLDETVNGIGMQLLLYMFALEEMGENRLGNTPHAAGVMYVPLSRTFSETRGESPDATKREGVLLRNFDIIDAMEAGDTKKYLPVSFKKDGSLTASSVVLTENEFSRIKKRLEDILKRIGDELSLGIIDPNPYSDGNSDSCRWCDYRSICAFDEERTDDRKRSLCEIGYKDILEKEGGK